MIGRTTLSALRALLLLARQESNVCWSPRRLAEPLGESPTYLAKVARHLVKRGILEAEKGAKGGVRLSRSPDAITLLDIVEACQGTLGGEYCRSPRPEASFCNFHRAAKELHITITGVLERWTLKDLLENPCGDGEAPGMSCLITRGLHEPAGGRQPKTGLVVWP